MTTRQAAHRARRVANGARQKSFLLSPEVIEKLEKLAVVYGSETKAVTAMILAAGENPWRDIHGIAGRACVAVLDGSRWSFHHAHWDEQQDAWLDIYSDRILNPVYWLPLPVTPA